VAGKFVPEQAVSAPVSPAGHSDPESEVLRSRSMLRPAVLLLLRDADCHGYQLMGRLAGLGVEVSFTTGALYRALRTMADDGLISSYWSTSHRGPARRVYSITDHGRDYLESSMPALSQLCHTVRKMLSLYRRGS
jgi:poly-beta-hydroxybutyrate-responsive repressor